MTSWRDKYPAGYLNNGDETTVKSLTEVLHTTRTSCRPSFQKTRYEIGVDCDEVYPNIYIGDAATAKSIPYLTEMGINNVLNTAEGNGFGMVNTNREYYKKTSIRYLGLPLKDLPMTNISKYFNETADFIDCAIRSGGKVLVHCLMGMSRSSTCVLSYLMIKEGMTAADALRRVRLNREIYPNEGFLHQLAELDNKLKRDRARGARL
ncbi:hypothetical protein C0J52_12918 [Blattella germanica]|nr:hypothetical protein C0J52_12918 [Blattella germanica]